MKIDTAAMKTYQSQTTGHSPLIVNGSGINWMRAQVDPGRLTADGSSRPKQKATWLACHLHARGASAFAATLDRTDRVTRPRPESATRISLTACSVVSSTSHAMHVIARRPAATPSCGRQFTR
ncbi:MULTISPECIES: hypothetical protein [unclassified Streptomyces]|uniref:hypothetical protein n=1 Tax=unclassified Streptomyces TaxID=2593676 RepID=UPI002DDC36E1|nr:hypothetical protein [Streptomyces sp. NBC_00243]WRZ17944.1 hypothetical protein OHT59_05290 [Streptomyces sp. NBC_00243]